MKKIIIPATIGNLMEWYDFTLYANFVTVLGELFFPKDTWFSSVAGFMVFAVGFIFRPLGGFLFGHIGDKFGRKRALTISVLLISSLTLVIAVLPTYEQIGLAAPITLFAIRIVQGLSIGGEYSGAITIMAEAAPPGRRTLYSSIALSTSSLGVLIGSLFAYTISNNMSEADLLSYGWRIPFFVGGAMGFFGLYMRVYMAESPEFLAQKKKHNIVQLPIKELLAHNRRGILVGLGVAVLNSSLYTIISTFMVYYVHSILGQPLSDATLLVVFSMLATCISCLATGAIADKLGPIRVAVVASMLVILMSFPVFLLIDTQIWWMQVLSLVLLGAFFGMAKGTLGVLLYSCFPTNVRFSGLSLCNNLAAMLISGLSPVLLFAKYDNLSLGYMPASIYLITVSIISAYYILQVKKFNFNDE